MLQFSYALVLELVDRHAWGACVVRDVEVQVFSGAPDIIVPSLLGIFWYKVKHNCIT